MEKTHGVLAQKIDYISQLEQEISELTSLPPVVTSVDHELVKQAKKQ
jgi:hypothetical protein